MEAFSFFLLSISICFVSLLLILFITNASRKQNFRGPRLAIFSAFICGILITLTPYLCLLTTQTIVFEVSSLLHLCKISFVSILFFFLFFVIINMIEENPVMPKRKTSGLQKDKIAFHSLSVTAAFFVLGFTYFVIQSFNIPVTLVKEQSIVPLVLLSASIYTLARIYEHLFMDKIIFQRKLSQLQLSFLFLMFSLCLNSSIFIFIKSLFLQLNFYMAIVAIVSMVVLLVSTIHYIENQLLHQQDQLEVKNQVLSLNEQRYRSLFENNPNAVFTLDLHWNFTAVNASVRPMIGFTLEELQHLTLTDLVLEQEKTKITTILEELAKGDNTNFETIMRTKSAEIVKLKVTALPIKINNEITGAYLIAQDITKQIEIQERVKFLAYHDELTGLLNRRGIYRELENHIHASTLTATILIDLDMFKDINDHLGHDAGDVLLKQVAERLTKTLGREELISRMGGDEFLICLTAPYKRVEVLERIQAIQAAMKEPFQIQQSSKEITLSIGVSFYPEDGENLNTLLKHADMAMYEAKKSGRNNAVQYSSRFGVQKLNQITLLQELKVAFEQEQLLLYFQPKHSTVHQSMVGVETLIRWNHPERGFINPGEFIPLAEENGLIVPLSNWIIQNAFKTFSNWLKEHDVNFHLSINISPTHFFDEDFVPFLLEQLQKYKIPAQLIDLEITENLAIENTELTNKKINILKEKGLQISMDDFGTGYTSLTYLSHFNMNRIKIDRSFIKELPDNRNNGAIVQSLLSVAKNLDILVTAEGVETEEQLNVLKEWGCDEIQGYYYSMPLPEEKLIAYWQGTN
ncbi:bifunctional diguanylate cyclase/phosphodiesterase [Lysinibacillus sp. SGAir0095]|uniref:putative bifunctional diguanylate cyclase/phosphodiesterase n=1 Tax=Lysinibacillus sp. SGAir0095 TaxID=2070463 RepID=UPI0010CD1BDD|nr:EAL domain-containing protein [Lysinibacillus sp. SGAir0095]QCR31896.1 hypothetical protein C1N55_06755 [Lysinibacillus sp. SGAir0095]